MTDRSVRPPASPIATYRLQFNSGFTFKDAERLVPYLYALGISHIYGSPYLKARAGSTHGYDIIDHNALNPEVGSAEDFEALVASLHRHRMGQIVDFVPNHMGIGQADNEWWLDLLEWGPSSPYAQHFDIDWQPTKQELGGKVLLPVLGNHYGEVLEQGDLQLRFDATQGSFSVWYHEHRFPIAPRQYARILNAGLEAIDRQQQANDDGLAELRRLATEFRKLRTGDVPLRHRPAQRQRAAELKQALADLNAGSPEVASAIGRSLQIFEGTPGEPRSFDPLHRLLEAQAYRLAFWRVAADEINYRRFFDINDLAGLRMELPELFDRTHRLIFRLIAENKIHGLRIDHIDGLYDPQDYCRRLQAQYRALRGSASGDASGDSPLYLVVEKILAQHERLREDWPIAGTTGYEFTNLVNGLFVDPAGERPLDRIYRRFIREHAVFDEILYACKKQVMAYILASELTVLATELDRIAEGNWRTRDFTLSSLREALREVVACFPVYRTYVTARGAGPEDRRDIDWAVGQARKRSAIPDRSIFDFVHDALTTDLVRAPRSGHKRRVVIRFAMKFQQYTGPVMAKGLEDTSFYRYNRLISLNEVGGDPRRFGVSVSAFHHLNQERARRWPTNMLATATHDTKRGEDVRTRIDLLSEIPQEWGRHVRRWARLNRRLKRDADGQPEPTANDEYLIYQTLLGAWPVELLDLEAAGPDVVRQFCDRCTAYMIKAVREAKQNSSWGNPNAAYEDAASGFLQQVLDVSRPNPFLADFVPFQRRVAVLGMLNSLSQAVLKLTLPGVPDVYQGCEMWDLSLVDPDNRRPVDYDRRVEALNRLRQGFPRDAVSPADAARLVDDWPDGRVKLYAIWKLLELRNGHPELFRSGGYRPLTVTGPQADHICAFAREGTDATIIVAVPRLLAKLMGEPDGLRPGCVDWADTAVGCPSPWNGHDLRAVLTGERLTASANDEQSLLPAEVLFANFPVAVLVATA
ncbi:malto-oligosyltrehalose synthase [Rhodospirillaceae bacterium SYSU D60014]|uniref:malto-oligosyltrehalose synthase n=1 Tax=Virgifigura deserti TaxID=2268457 RepID=UPI000E66D06F